MMAVEAIESMKTWELDRLLTVLEFELQNKEEAASMGEVARKILLSRKGQVRSELHRRNATLV